MENFQMFHAYITHREKMRCEKEIHPFPSSFHGLESGSFSSISKRAPLRGPITLESVIFSDEDEDLDYMSVAVDQV